MANLNPEFQDFLSNITINKSKKDKLKKAKDALREKITKHFDENHPDYDPEFFIQGSYKMYTMIRTKDDTCDLDDGVYFFREPDVTPETLQRWVKNAVEDHTNTPPQHHKKCIRVIYAGDYNIDLPVFYEKKKHQNGNPIKDPKTYLAQKTDGWRIDDPDGFVKWFEKQKDSSRQLIRVIKYLKAWCDYKANKMPSGLEITLLATKYISYHQRDDISLKNTLEAIQNGLNNQWVCRMPTEPKDDLFEDYSDTRKKNFLDALEKFIQDATKALEEENYQDASKKWRKHLSKERFPLGKDEIDENQKQANKNRANAKKLGAEGLAFDKFGNSTSDNNGQRGIKHRNFGRS